MKFLVFLLLSVFVIVESNNERGCIYIMGKCDTPCPEGTHAYSTGCGRLMPEATCNEPHPKQEEDIICDYFNCYCDPPTVKDPTTKKCVKLEDCPKKD